MSNHKLFKHEWIWEKQKANNFMGAKYQPLKYHENVLVFGKGKVNYYPQKYKVLEIDEMMEMNKKELTNLMKIRDYDRFGKIDKRKTINDSNSSKEYLGTKVKRTRVKDTGYRNPKSVLKINKEVNNLIHPTQKPVELFEYLIKTYTNEGEIVLDNCMGSGTTAIACMNTNRNYIGFELDEEYYKASLDRINKQLEDK